MARKTQKVGNSVEDKLYDLCLDIFAHAHLDYEITLGGNGTNACEAAAVATAVLKILGKKASDKEIEKRAKEVEASYNS